MSCASYTIWKTLLEDFSNGGSPRSIAQNRKKETKNGRGLMELWIGDTDYESAIQRLLLMWVGD